jgi:hypothetical protein
MADSPNTSPSFIRTAGILGSVVSLTNQVCTRDNPGSIPVVLYDSNGAYAGGNGALAEDLTVCATGPIAKSVLFMFIKFTSDTNPVWVNIAEWDLPALASVSATTASASYPLSLPLRNILAPQPHSSTTTAQFKALRINSSGRAIQLGLALGTAIGSLPLIATLWGGEL